MNNKSKQDIVKEIIKTLKLKPRQYMNIEGLPDYMLKKVLKLINDDNKFLLENYEIRIY